MLPGTISMVTSTTTPSSLGSRPSDLLFYMALALLPVDGTVLGWPLPYWTPLAPWCFLAYTIANWRLAPLLWGRWRLFLPLPVLLTALSVFGWHTLGLRPGPALRSLVSLLLGLACLVAIDIALSIRRLPWRSVLTVLVASYTLAFLIGLVQYAALRCDWTTVLEYFGRLLYRNYGSVRPQFLFAEPSYIGMHVFGVLLPVFWLTRDRRVGLLVPLFAGGSILMGAGTRIVLDSIVAGALWLVVELRLHGRRQGLALGLSSVCVLAGAASAVLFNPRLHAIARRGLLAGDASMSSRIFHMLAPMSAWMHDPWHLTLGYGAGNIAVAVRRGYEGALRAYLSFGGVMNAEIRGLAHPPDNTFTMSAYASFITEFGLVGFALLTAAVLAHFTVMHAWNRTTLCWLILVAYLYVQFEAYAFYALWLFVWAAPIVGRRPLSVCAGVSEDSQYSFQEDGNIAADRPVLDV